MVRCYTPRIGRSTMAEVTLAAAALLVGALVAVGPAAAQDEADGSGWRRRPPVIDVQPPGPPGGDGEPRGWDEEPPAPWDDGPVPPWSGGLPPVPQPPIGPRGMIPPPMLVQRPDGMTAMLVFGRLDEDRDGELGESEYVIPKAVAVGGFALQQGQRFDGRAFVEYFGRWLTPWLSFRYFGARPGRDLDRMDLRRLGVEPVFSGVDRSRDGTIDFGEWTASPRQAWVMARFPMGALPAMILDYDRYDRSCDGVVDALEEPLLVSKMDGDGDGTVTLPEFLAGLDGLVGPGRPAFWLVMADRDGDLRLDANEAAACGHGADDMDGDGLVTLRDVLARQDEPAPTAEPTLAVPTVAVPTVALPTARSTPAVLPVRPTVRPTAAPTPVPPSLQPSATPVRATVAPAPIADEPPPTADGPYLLLLVAFVPLLLGIAFAVRRSRLQAALPVDAEADQATVVVDKTLLRARGLVRRRAWQQAIPLLQPVAGGDASMLRDQAALLLVRCFLGTGATDAAKAALDGVDMGRVELGELYDVARAFQGAGAAGTASSIFNRIYARDVGFRDVRERLEATATAGPRDLGQVASPEATLERLGDRYRDPRRIGAGAMGAVFAVYDTVLRRDVAVKVLHAGTAADDRSRDRFMREARALARLSHPNVPPVYDVAAEPTPYYSMPLLRGRDLAAYRTELVGAADGAARDEVFEKMLSVACDVTGALAHAHRRGILHRDVKPQNVLVTFEGRAYLVDFGLARMSDATRMTGSNEIVGTLRYLAPELMTDRGTFDERTDVFALGVTLFEWFAGRHPFGESGVSVVAVLGGRAAQQAPPVTTVATWLPAGLDGVLARCLAIDPAKRYESCDQVLAALEGLRAEVDGVSAAGAAAAVRRRGGGAEGERVLSVARQVERVYQERLHSLKNLVGVVQRYRSKPERLAGRFFSPTTLARLDELAGPALVDDVAAVLREAGERPPPIRAPAVHALATLTGDGAGGGLATRATGLRGLASAPPERQRDVLTSWHERLTGAGKVIVTALRALDVDLAGVVGRAGRAVAGDVRLGVDMSEAPSVWCADPAAAAADFLTVLAHLFQNAVQARARRVTVKATATPNATHVAVEVGNDGAPVSAEAAAELFRRPATTKRDGTGGGMSTCRSLLARWGGSVSLASPSPVRFVVMFDRGRMGGGGAAGADDDGAVTADTEDGA